MLDLNFSGTVVVSGLFVDGVAQAESVYDSGNTTFLLGSGSITVVPEPGLAAFVLGLGLLAFVRLKRRKA